MTSIICLSRAHWLHTVIRDLQFNINSERRFCLLYRSAYGKDTLSDLPAERSYEHMKIFRFCLGSNPGSLGITQSRTLLATSRSRSVFTYIYINKLFIIIYFYRFYFFLMFFFTLQKNDIAEVSKNRFENNFVWTIITFTLSATLKRSIIFG